MASVPASMAGRAKTASPARVKSASAPGAMVIAPEPAPGRLDRRLVAAAWQMMPASDGRQVGERPERDQGQADERHGPHRLQRDDAAPERITDAGDLGVDAAHPCVALLQSRDPEPDQRHHQTGGDR